MQNDERAKQIKNLQTALYNLQEAIKLSDRDIGKTLAPALKHTALALSLLRKRISNDPCHGQDQLFDPY